MPQQHITYRIKQARREYAIAINLNYTIYHLPPHTEKYYLIPPPLYDPPAILTLNTDTV